MFIILNVMLAKREQICCIDPPDLLVGVEEKCEMNAVKDASSSMRIVFKCLLPSSSFCVLLHIDHHTTITMATIDYEHGGTTADLLDLIESAAKLTSEGRFDQAEPIYLSCLEAMTNEFGANHVDTISCISNLALLYMTQKLWAKALPLLTRCVESKKHALGTGHASTLGSLTNLGVCLKNVKQYDAAEVCYKECLEHRPSNELGSGVDDGASSATLTVLNNLATLYSEQKKYGLAEPLLVECLESRRRVFGSLHADTLASVNNLAVLSYRMGSEDNSSTVEVRQNLWRRASGLYEECLSGQRQLLGDDHPATLATMSHLARLYGELQEWTKAEELLTECTEGRLLSLGDTQNTQNTLNTQSDRWLEDLTLLARVYEQRAQSLTPVDGADEWLARSEQLLRQVLNHRRALDEGSSGSQADGPQGLPGSQGQVAVCAAQSIACADVLYRLGSVLEARSQWDQAEESYQDCRARRRGVLGDLHVDTLQVTGSLGVLYARLAGAGTAGTSAQQGHFESAEELLWGCLEGRRRVMGESHRTTLRTLAQLAMLYRDHGYWEESEGLYTEHLGVCEAHHGAESEETLNAANNLAILYQRLERYDEAEVLYERCLHLWRVLPGKGPYHPDTLTAMSNLALLYDSRGKGALALPMHEEALTVRRQTLGEDHLQTLNSLNNLVGRQARGILFCVWWRFLTRPLRSLVHVSSHFHSRAYISLALILSRTYSPQPPSQPPLQPPRFSPSTRPTTTTPTATQPSPSPSTVSA